MPRRSLPGLILKTKFLDLIQFWKTLWRNTLRRDHFWVNEPFYFAFFGHQMILTSLFMVRPWSLKSFANYFTALLQLLVALHSEYWLSLIWTLVFVHTVTGGQHKKAKDRKHPRKADLQAAVFFAAGVTMHQRLQCLLETNSKSTLLRTQESINHGVSSTTGSSRVLLRSQSDEFDVKRVLSSRSEIPKPEVNSDANLLCTSAWAL